MPSPKSNEAQFFIINVYNVQKWILMLKIYAKLQLIPQGQSN